MAFGTSLNHLGPRLLELTRHNSLDLVLNTCKAVCNEKGISRMLLSICASCVLTAEAGTTILLPVDDGGVYSSGSIYRYTIPVGNNVHGDLQFANFDSLSCTSITLELSPYALPSYGPVGIYGFDNAAGYLTASDFNAGTFLGWFGVPNQYGQPGYFDVTAFVKSTHGAYFGFCLQPYYSGGAELCSTAVNYGLPPELIVVPEPSGALLLAFVGCLFCLQICGQSLSAH